jgi:acyl-CoA-binding protein
MNSKNKMPEWYEIYSQGTVEGEEEKKFFISLARNKKYKNWRSVSAISKEIGISDQRIEEIIFKYNKMGLIVQNPANTEFWGYYYNNLEDVKEDPISVIEEERKKILKKTKNP